LRTSSSWVYVLSYLIFFFPSSESIDCLAVRLVGSLGNDTLVDEVDVAPVLTLSTLTINLSSRVRDGSPEGATRNIFAPSIALGIEQGLAGFQAVVEHGLERPFTDEDGELGFLGNVSCLTADGGVDVAGVGAGSREVVYVRVEDDVGGCVVERGPVGGAHEAVLDHHGDALVLKVRSVHVSQRCGRWVSATYHFGNLLEDTIEVSVDPVGTVDGETSRRSETSKVVGSLVDGSNGEGIHVTAVLDKLEDTVDGLERVVEIGGVVEPGVVEKSLANVEVVDTTRERVETNND
jgi:hypothetical protein